MYPERDRSMKDMTLNAMTLSYPLQALVSFPFGREMLAGITTMMDDIDNDGKIT